jgi:hypothetical protein
LQGAYDVALRTFKQEDRNYQTAKNIAEGLDVGYQIEEGLIARLGQDHDLKRAVHERAVIFYKGNKQILTTLAGVYVSARGLHEGTEVLGAMKKGFEEGMKDIAEFGGKIKEKALELAFGEFVSKDALQIFVNSITDWESFSGPKILEYRALATQNVKDAAEIVNTGKQKRVEIYLRYATAKQQ